jgi:hypothetical protein
MQDVRIDRLSVALLSLILQGMKKAHYAIPTSEELYALERRARRARALHVAALLRAAYARIRAAFTAKVVRHA